ncbi:hypothetical protein GCM10012319_59630 [Comamonas sp. KCTC 72670]|nr:hypothetical protein GCM10012319_59630 [Comamonas sp. KCTC 72670]
MAGTEGGALRGAVAVHQSDALSQPLADTLRREHIAASEQLGHSPQRLRLMLLHLVEEGRRQPEHRNTVPLERLPQLREVRRPLGMQHQPGAVKQRTPDLQRGGIEGQGRQLEHHLVGPQVHEARTDEQAHHTSVGNGHALRRPRGARSVGDVRELLRAHARVRDRRVGLQGDLRPVRVQAHDELRPRGKFVLQRHLGEHDGDARVIRHEGQPLRRVRRVERHVAAARLENAQQPHQQVEPAVHEDADARLGPDAQRAQVAGELVGARIQLRVRQRASVVLHGHRSRRPRGLLHEQGRNRRVLGVRDLRVVPRRKHLLALPSIHQREFTEPPLQDAFSQGRQQDAQMLDHPTRGVLREEVQAVFELPLEASVPRHERQRQVEPGRVRRVREHLHVHTRQRWGLEVRAQQHEEHLEQRRAGQVPLTAQGIDQLLEGHVLVGEGTQRLLTNGGEDVREGRIPREAAPQRERIDEEADEPLQLPLRARGHGRADGEVRLAGVAGQQRLPTRHQHHVQGGVVRPANVLELGDQVGGQGEEERRAPGTANGRPGMVGGQLQRRRPFEPRAPPVPLRLQRRALQHAPLPFGVVGVLHLQRGQGGFVAERQRLVQRADLPHQHAHGPTVRDDVVHAQQQDVGVRARAQQHRPEQRPGLQREGAVRLLVHALLDGGFARGRVQRAQFLHGQRPLGRRRVDALGGLAVLRYEGGAERLMAAHDLREGASQERHVEGPRQPQGHGHVIDGEPGLELLHEPQAPLSERDLEGAFAIASARQRLQRDGVRDARVSVKPGGELRHRGGLEERAERQVHLERRADASHHLRGQQGVTSQFEEVVVPTDPGGVKHVLPHLHQPRFRRRGRGLRDGGASHPRGVGDRQRLAVDLATGGQRQGRECNEGGRHHVLGQPLLEVLTQPLRREAGLSGPDDVGHEPLVSGHVLAHQGNGIPDVGVRPKAGFDFPQLDAEAAQLHLEVQPAQVLQRAVLSPSGLVARAVQPRTRRGGEGVGNEALRRQVRPAQVATRQPFAREVQLSSSPLRRQRQTLIEHVHLRPSQGLADDRDDRPVVRLRQERLGSSLAV